MTGLRVAVAFLTRVPVGSAEVRPIDLTRSVPWFPVVGALLGTAVAGVYAAALQVLPALVAAAVAIGCGVLSTGAFHEDGLADLVDALGGGWNREDSLRILKDPRHGTFGVLAATFDVILRVGVLAALGGWAALAVLPAAHALARAAAIGLLGVAAPATGDGLGASYATALTRPRVLVTIGVGLALGTVAMGWWVVPAALLAAAGAGIVGRLSVRRLGGVTGDALGAAEQIAEILVMLLGVALVTRGVSPAWWTLSAWWTLPGWSTLSAWWTLPGWSTLSAWWT